MKLKRFPMALAACAVLAGLSLPEIADAEQAGGHGGGGHGAGGYGVTLGRSRLSCRC